MDYYPRAFSRGGNCKRFFAEVGGIVDSKIFYNDIVRVFEIEGGNAFAVFVLLGGKALIIYLPLDAGLFTVLAAKSQKRILNQDMFNISSIFNEDDLAFGVALWDRINGSLETIEVA